VKLLVEKYADAKAGSITLLVLSPMTDVAQLIREQQQLFATKTWQVVIMGGLREASNDKRMVGDDTARNHLLDTTAANFVLRKCQEIGVQVVVMSRWSAYGCAMPAFLYDECALQRDKLALWARDVHVRALGLLWRQISGGDDYDRDDIPPRCDRSWFAETFCGGVEVPLSETDIRPHVMSVILYNVLALLACCPHTLSTFFEVETRTTNGVDHLVVGASKKRSGVADVDDLRKLLTASLHSQLIKAVH